MKTWSRAVLGAGWLACVSCGATGPTAEEPDYELQQSSAAQVGSIAEVLNRNSEEPGWPKMPRIWADITRTSYEEGKLNIGLMMNFGGVESGITHQTSFKMGRKTTVIFITTKTEENQKLTFRDDSGVHFNVLPDSQYVALCVYTSFLTTNQEVLAKLTAHGSGVSAATGLESVINRTNYSKFMQVSSLETPSHYLNTVCDTIFRETVEDEVKEDLAALAHDVLRYSNPQDKCIPDEELAWDGDASCQDWHEGLIPSVQAWTVPRCEANAKGAFRCVLKSREGGDCPLFEHPNGAWKTNPVADSKRLTPGQFEYYCDKGRGLHCVMTEQPGWLSSAKAECKSL